MDDEWLTTTQAGRELGGVTPDTVRNYVEAGLLRAEVTYLVQGKRYRIRRSWVQDFRRRHVRDTTTEGWDR